MAKPSSPATPPPPVAPSWINYLLVALSGALLGATGMYLLLLPKLTQPTATTSYVSSPAPAPSQSNLPPPALTAGQSPAQAARTLGNFYYDHQNWPEAIRHYESALKQGSDDSDIRTDLGNAYRFSGRPQDALTQYLTAQRMNPAHEFSLFNQGGLYLEDFRQPEKAIALWQEYLTRFPQGRNLAAARQLIAQAQGATTPLTPGTTDPAEEARLLKLMAPALKP